MPKHIQKNRVQKIPVILQGEAKDDWFPRALDEAVKEDQQDGDNDNDGNPDDVRVAEALDVFVHGLHPQFHDVDVRRGDNHADKFTNVSILGAMDDVLPVFDHDDDLIVDPFEDDGVDEPFESPFP